VELDFCKKVNKFGKPTLLTSDISFMRGEQQDINIIIDDLYHKLHQYLEKSIMEYVIDNSKKEYCLSIPDEYIIESFSLTNKPILSYEMFQDYRKKVFDLTSQHIHYDKVNIVNRPVLSSNVIVTYDQIEVYYSDVKYIDNRDNPDTYQETIWAKLEYSVRLVGEVKSLFVITENGPEYNQIKLMKRRDTINKILNK